MKWKVGQNPTKPLTQVDGDYQEVEGEDVNLPRPPLDRGLSGRDDFGVEEGVEGVHVGPVVVGLGTLADQVHVEVDDLIVQPVQTYNEKTKHFFYINIYVPSYLSWNVHLAEFQCLSG